MRFWQAVTVALLMSGYAGYYSLPLESFRAARDHGIVRRACLCERKISQRRPRRFFGRTANYLFGMAGSVLFTFLFAVAGRIPLFALAWIGNRAAQSLGWAGAAYSIARAGRRGRGFSDQRGRTI
jgi:hypothetical protein